MNHVTTEHNIHSALFYDSADDLLAAAVPFLRSGLARGETAVLVCREPHNTMLVDALDADPRLVVPEPGGIYLRAANAVAAYRRLFRERLPAGATRVRLVGEIDVGDAPGEWAEWARYEALINIAFASYPLWNMCAYDTRGLPEPVRAGVMRTHPQLFTAGTLRRNEQYADPVSELRRSADSRPDPLEATRPTIEVADLTDATRIPGLRHHLGGLLADAGLPRDLAADFVTAVNEVVTNAFVHGRPPVRARLWLAPDRLLCAVTDAGDGFDDPLAGYVLPDDDNPHAAGAGLRLARQCCDRLTTARGGDGFTVRLSTRLPAAPR